jgi:hypothetical protein
MKTRSILATGLIALLMMVPLLTGCGGGEEEAATAETPEAAAESVATHDCAGACGMTAVPEDQLTEIDGKWYCAGCAAKAKEGGADSGHG